MNNRLHKIWYDMVRRCTNPKCSVFPRYGGRGIRVCDEWLESKNFKAWAYESGYNPSLTIDRVDVNGDYTPENCRWATYSEQAQNKRNNRLLNYKGETKTITQWSEEMGLTFTAIAERINRNYPIEKILDPRDRRKLRRIS